MTRQRLNLLLLLVLAPVALALASCSSMPTVEIPKTVYVQVPSACVDPAKRPKRPHLRSFDDLMAMDRATRTLAAAADLKKYEAYAAELEAVVEGCSRIPRAPP